MSQSRTNAPEILEPGTHVFSGTIRVWRSDYGELLTDSGVTVQLITQGQPMMREGERVTIVTRRFRPLYQVEQIIEG
jgi:hypothetical protein